MSDSSASFRKDFLTRLASALPLVPLILLALYRGPWWTFGPVVAVAVIICGRELFGMMLPDSAGLRAYGVLASLAVYGACSFSDHLGGTPVVTSGALLVLLFGALLSGMIAPDPIEGAAARTGWLFGGPIYLGASLAHVERLHLLSSGAGWVVMSMMFAWFSDTTAYFAGRFFGKNKLYPKLSPKKTVEGALGGLVGSVGGGLFGHFLLVPGLPLVDAVLLGIVAGAFGQAGDLFESMLKRSSGVKDSGAFLPGHGGLLDRIDALMFTAPITYLYATLIFPGR